MRTLPLTPFCILIFAITIFSISTSQYGGVNEYGAGFMPTTISALLLFFASIDLVMEFKKRHKNLSTFSTAEFKALALVVVSVMMFVCLVDIMGFVICSCLLLFTLMKVRGVKLPMAVGVASAASLIIYFVFARVLLVALPSATWL